MDLPIGLERIDEHDPKSPFIEQYFFTRCASTLSGCLNWFYEVLGMGFRLNYVQCNMLGKFARLHIKRRFRKHNFLSIGTINLLPFYCLLVLLTSGVFDVLFFGE